MNLLTEAATLTGTDLRHMERLMDISARRFEQIVDGVVQMNGPEARRLLYLVIWALRGVEMEALGTPDWAELLGAKKSSAPAQRGQRPDPLLARFTNMEFKNQF